MSVNDGEAEEEVQQAAEATYTAELASNSKGDQMEPISLGVPERELNDGNAAAEGFDEGGRSPPKGATPFAVSRLPRHSAVMLDTSGDGKVTSAWRSLNPTTRPTLAKTVVDPPSCYVVFSRSIV